jgi:hypothetical protein
MNNTAFEYIQSIVDDTFEVMIKELVNCIKDDIEQNETDNKTKKIIIGVMQQKRLEYIIASCFVTASLKKVNNYLDTFINTGEAVKNNKKKDL